MMSNQVTTVITTDKAVANNELRLSICLRPNGFSFSMMTLDRTLLTFGEADFDFALPMSKLPAAIKSFLTDSNIPTFGCKEVRFIIPSDHTVWIPEHLFDSSQCRRYIRMISEPNSRLGVYHALSERQHAYAVFTAPTDIVTAFKLALPGIDAVCQHSLLANETLSQRSAQHPVMLMNVRDGNGDYEAFFGQQLLLSNSYPAKDGNELLYHAIDVMKQLHIETPDMELLICGDVGREIFAELQHYFPNVALYTGLPFNYINPEFQTLHTYRHALLLS